MTDRAPSCRRLPVSLAILWLAAGCSGDGCSCAQPIPGGFPPEARVPGAAQIRLTQTGLAAVQADPARLIGEVLGRDGSALDFPVPPSCGGNPEICCKNGVPSSPCGPILVDLTARPGDPPRMVIAPQSGQSQIVLTMRARAKTARPLPFVYRLWPFTFDCSATLDSERSGSPSIEVRANVSFSLEPAPLATTRAVVQAVNIVPEIESGDIEIQGSLSCDIANWFVGLFTDTIAAGFENTLRDTLNDQLCKRCPSGLSSSCGVANATCQQGVCMRDNACLQELGFTGRVTPASLLGLFGAGNRGQVDFYDVAGGYVNSDNQGLSLGILGGALPGSSPQQRCGPPAPPPQPVSIGPSPFFQGNQRPDTGAAFDVALGIHQHHLHLLAHAAYDSGSLCLDVGTQAVNILHSDTLAVVIPSLVDLTHGQTAQILVGLRPQSPPRIALGLGTFRDVGGQRVVHDPLLDLRFDGLEIDLFAMIDDQFIRLATLAADVRLPLNLEGSPHGELIPVLGELDGAFTNLRVFAAHALLESEAELADRFPVLLSLALSLLGSRLGPVALPQVGGLHIAFDPGNNGPGDITSVENRSFLAIFGDLVATRPQAARVETEAEIVAVTQPPTEVFAAAHLDAAQRPSVELRLGGRAPDGSADLEWSYRIDEGFWSPYSRSTSLRLSPELLWLQARHRIEVRARRAGQPFTTDLSPVVLEPIIDTIAPTALLAHPSTEAVWMMASDNVSRRRLAVEYRFANAAWTPAGAVPLAIPLGDHAATDLEVRVRDEAGNVAVVRPAAHPAPWMALPGPGPAGGCSVTSESSSSATAVGLILFVCLAGAALPRKPRRRRGAFLTRAKRALWPITVGLCAAALPSGCNCSGALQCPDNRCLAGEVERGPTGRWSSLAASPSRTAVAAYEERLGDLVLVEMHEATPRYQVVDGVPRGVAPRFEPTTYRGGVTEAGPDVGAHTCLVMVHDRAHITYQDIDRGALKFARETDEGWSIHEVDPGPGGAGLYSSLALAGDGTPAIAYMAAAVDDGHGYLSAQLRYARARTPSPESEADWTIEVVDSAAISCAGLCPDKSACLAEPHESRCAPVTADCAPTCARDQACVAGTCRAVLPAPPAHDLPRGTGLFANLIVLGDGSPAIVYYDRARGRLAMQRFAGGWKRTDLYAGEGDGGMWASARVDSAGTVHVAFQADGSRLLYVRFASGAAMPIEVVDDGQRMGDRPHRVGASAALFIDGTGVTGIAYQDGTSSDLLVARRSGSGWEPSPLLADDHLYGFFIRAATTAAGVIVSSYYYDRSVYPPGELRLIRIP